MRVGACVWCMYVCVHVSVGCMCVCVKVHVCGLHVCVEVHVCMCMWVAYVWRGMWVECICVWGACVCMHVCLEVRVYVYACMCGDACVLWWHVCGYMYVSGVQVCVGACVWGCMCV